MIHSLLLRPQAFSLCTLSLVRSQTHLIMVPISRNAFQRESGPQPRGSTTGLSPTIARGLLQPLELLGFSVPLPPTFPLLSAGTSMLPPESSLRNSP